MNKLTPIENTIMEYVAEGLSNAEIGERLHYSTSRIDNMIYRIYIVLGVPGGQGGKRIRAVNAWRATL